MLAELWLLAQCLMAVVAVMFFSSFAVMTWLQLTDPDIEDENSQSPKMQPLDETWTRDESGWLS